MASHPTAVSRFDSADELETLAAVLRENRLTTQSDIVRMEILAHLSDSPAVLRTTLVTSGSGARFRIRRWQEVR